MPENDKIRIRKIVLSINRELLSFVIVDRNIFYTDRKFRALIRILPKPKNFIQAINNSRNRIPMFLANLFNFTEQEMSEYNAAKNVDELAEIIIRDGRKNGCVPIANGDIEADAQLIADITKLEVVV